MKKKQMYKYYEACITPSVVQRISLNVAKLYTIFFEILAKNVKIWKLKIADSIRRIKT